MSNLNWNLPTFPLSFPVEDKAYIWKFYFDQNFNYVSTLKKILPCAEKERAGNYIFQKDRTKFILSRGILRLICSHILGISPSDVTFKYGTYGKPYLHECHSSNLQFNLSHSSNILLICFALDLYVGIDIEKICNILEWQSIAHNCFSVREKEILFSMPEEEKAKAFFNIWTRKEAYIKAIGKGLSIPLDQFNVLLDFSKSKTILAKNIHTKRSFCLQEIFCHPEYAATLAIEGSTSNIQKYLGKLEDFF